jgi:hypothetical protein
MSEKPKRSWFRFHLLTAVLLMIIAGVFLHLDLSWREFEDEQYSGDIFNYSILHWQAIGWPIVFEYRSFWPDNTIRPLTTIRIATGRYFDAYKLAVDILVALGFLTISAFVSEWMIRREARKT